MTQDASTAVAISSTALQAADFKPLLDLSDAVERRNLIVGFVKSILVDGVDYGTIPGTQKPTLLKPGMEKLCAFFGFCPEFVTEVAIEDWTGKDHNREQFFYYRYKCLLKKNGVVIAEGIGSCNTWETKYRYRWVPAANVPKTLNIDALECQDRSIREPAFAIERAETTGKYGKPAEYWQRFKDAIAAGTAVKGTMKAKSGREIDTWEIPQVMYRVPNTDAADAVNTCQKMAQKRALAAPVLLATNTSEFFTQDVEDMEILEASIIEGTYRREPPPPRQEADTGAGATGNEEDVTLDREDAARKPAQTRTARTAPAERTVGSGKTSAAAAAAAAGAQRDPGPPPDMYDPSPSGDDWTQIDIVEATNGIENAESMADLTARINAVPPAHRKPDSLPFKAFLKRREFFAAQKQRA